MEAIEFKKVYKAYYSPKPGKPEIIEMPEMQFMMIDGQGDPNNSQQFQDDIRALYGVIYGLKFSRKKAGIMPDFTVGPLECLYWTKSGKHIDSNQKDDWLWTLMIWVPDFINDEDLQNQIQVIKIKKPELPLDKIRLDKFNEAKVVQIMHIGPYDQEEPNIRLMHSFAEQKDYNLGGKHHEIYLGDPRRAAPEKLRTILRQPIQQSQ